MTQGRHTHVNVQLSVNFSVNLHVFAARHETRTPGGDPQRHWINIEIPLRANLAGTQTQNLPALLDTVTNHENHVVQRECFLHVKKIKLALQKKKTATIKKVGRGLHQKVIRK